MQTGECLDRVHLISEAPDMRAQPPLGRGRDGVRKDAVRTLRLEQLLASRIAMSILPELIAAEMAHEHQTTGTEARWTSLASSLLSSSGAVVPVTSAHAQAAKATAPGSLSLTAWRATE